KSIEGIVAELLDAREASGGLDVIADVANPLPTDVIADMLGAGRDDRVRFRRWSDDLAAFFGGRPSSREGGMAAAEGCREMTEHLRSIVAERRRAPKDDIVSALVAAEDSGSNLTEEELIGTCVLLLFAGHETTTHLIG